MSYRWWRKSAHGLPKLAPATLHALLKSEVAKLSRKPKLVVAQGPSEAPKPFVQLAPAALENSAATRQPKPCAIKPTQLSQECIGLQKFDQALSEAPKPHE